MLRDLFSLFPAYAGVILEISATFTPPFSFPRTCGGDPRDQTILTTFDAFSPHMRG